MRLSLFFVLILASIVPATLRAGSLESVHSETVASAPPSRPQLLDPAALGFGRADPIVIGTVYDTMDFSDGSGALDMVESRLRLPLYRKRFDSGWGFGASLIHEYTSADLNGHLLLDRLDLHSLELQFSLRHFPGTDTGWMGLLIASPGLATDFEDIGSDDFSFRLIGVAGYQFSPRFTLALAGYFAQSIGEQTALPGFGVIWRPSDDWMVQLTPPFAAIGWQATDTLSFSVSGFPSGGSWDISEEPSPVADIDISGWRVGIGSEYRLTDNWRINVIVGVNLFGNIELRDSEEIVLNETDLDEAMFGMLGVSYRF